MATSNRFSVLVRENASDLQPRSLTIDLKEQLRTTKETSLSENTATSNNDKRSDKPYIKIYQKGIAIAPGKPVVKRR